MAQNDREFRYGDFVINTNTGILGLVIDHSLASGRSLWLHTISGETLIESQMRGEWRIVNIFAESHADQLHALQLAQNQLRDSYVTKYDHWGDDE